MKPKFTQLKLATLFLGVTLSLLTCENEQTLQVKTNKVAEL